ncbi:MAG: hypothetical protein AMJ66_02385 [Betaproteobacteria bacterium SG8_40]|nr:MAG: hypothetical protein AMJ66_02385 [Betaproteobacteria bacterium SG8_40]
MRWEQFFWVVYGIGSTLFVFFLFKLGNAVAGDREESIKREIARPRNPEQKQTEVAPDAASAPQGHTGRPRVGSAVAAGEAKPNIAVASVDAAKEFLLTTGGFHAESGVHGQAEQGRR